MRAGGSPHYGRGGECGCAREASGKGLARGRRPEDAGQRTARRRQEMRGSGIRGSACGAVQRRHYVLSYDGRLYLSVLYRVRGRCRGWRTRSARGGDPIRSERFARPLSNCWGLNEAGQRGAQMWMRGALNQHRRGRVLETEAVVAFGADGFRCSESGWREHGWLRRAKRWSWRWPDGGARRADGHAVRRASMGAQTPDGGHCERTHRPDTQGSDGRSCVYR